MEKLLVIGFIILGGFVGLHVLISQVVPTSWRVALVNRLLAQPTTPPPRRRRVQKVDQFALCRINRIAWHHQRRFAAEMTRETKREMVSLTEVRPAHDPQMLALAQLVRAKLVTQTAGLQTLYDVRLGDNAAYQTCVQEFRAALAYVNLHGTAPATAQRSTAEPTRANAA